MAVDVQSLEREVSSLRQRLAEVERSLGKLPARIAAPTAGLQIKFAAPNESLWSGSEPVQGRLYALQNLDSPEQENVEITTRVSGYFFGSAAVAIKYPAIRIGGQWSLLSGGYFVARALLAENLPQGGSATASISVTPQIGETVEVHDNWGGAVDGDVALAGDAIGVAWNQGAEQWEVWVSNCHDELAEEPEEE